MCQNRCRKLPGLTSLNSLKQSYEVAWVLILSIFFQIKELKHRKWTTYSRSHHCQRTEQAGIQMQATWWRKLHLLLRLLETIKANTFIWVFAGFCSRALQGWIHFPSQQPGEAAVTVPVQRTHCFCHPSVGGRAGTDLRPSALEPVLPTVTQNHPWASRILFSVFWYMLETFHNLNILMKIKPELKTEDVHSSLEYCGEDEDLNALLVWAGGKKVGPFHWPSGVSWPLLLPTPIIPGPVSTSLPPHCVVIIHFCLSVSP